MKLLKEIKDSEIPNTHLRCRIASRAVLLDENNMVPLLFVSKYGYHKLPGGGVKPDENRIMALEREVKEETGCKIKITGEIGRIIEFRSRFGLKQTSYCYSGKVLSKGKVKFTKKELRDGFKLIWIPLDDAITRIKNDKPSNYEGCFIQKRDLIFLKKAGQFM